MSHRSAYDVLGLPPSASAADVRRAYRTLAKDAHPDRAGADPSAHERFLELKAAYELLADPDSRAAYDRDPTGKLEASLAAERRAGQLARRKKRLRRLYE